MVDNNKKWENIGHTGEEGLDQWIYMDVTNKQGSSGTTAWDRLGDRDKSEKIEMKQGRGSLWMEHWEEDRIWGVEALEDDLRIPKVEERGWSPARAVAPWSLGQGYNFTQGSNFTQADREAIVCFNSSKHCG